MGGKSSKNKDEGPTIIPQKRNVQDTRLISLLVLCDESDETEQARDIADNFCDALNSFPPPGSLEVNQRDIKVSQLPKSGSLPQSKHAEIKQWISQHLEQNHVVLVCSLTNGNVQSFADGINLHDGKIINCSFQGNGNECLNLDIDPKSIKDTKAFKGKLDDLVATIKAEGN